MFYTLLYLDLSQTLSLPLVKYVDDLANTLQAVNHIPTTVSLQSAFFKGKAPKIICCWITSFTAYFLPLGLSPPLLLPCVFHHLCELIGKSLYLEQWDFILDF